MSELRGYSVCKGFCPYLRLEKDLVRTIEGLFIVHAAIIRVQDGWAPSMDLVASALRVGSEGWLLDRCPQKKPPEAVLSLGRESRVMQVRNCAACLKVSVRRRTLVRLFHPPPFRSNVRFGSGADLTAIGQLLPLNKPDSSPESRHWPSTRVGDTAPRSLHPHFRTTMVSAAAPRRKKWAFTSSPPAKTPSIPAKRTRTWTLDALSRHCTMLTRPADRAHSHCLAQPHLDDPQRKVPHYAERFGIALQDEYTPRSK